MYISEKCAECLFDKQRHITDDALYLREVRDLLDSRKETDTSPYMVYLFNKAYERRFGPSKRYGEIKKHYNDLALSMETRVRERIERSEDPLRASIAFARAGNYIDFGAMNTVDEATFHRLFQEAELGEADMRTYSSFLDACRSGRRFLLIADNCGEIVFDKLFIEQLKKRFPDMEVTVMVRGSEVLNDVTKEDADYVNLSSQARVVSNGNAVAGTVCALLSEEAKAALDTADVILAKGQGNYESLSREGYHVFYSFLCKCDLFTERYRVPYLAGIFTEEN